MKSELRQKMIARRDALPAAERARLADALTAELTRLPQYASAQYVLATMSLGSEWNTRAFLDRAQADGKVVVLPRVTPPPKHLALHAVEDLDRHLVAGVWGIPEPDPAHCPEVDFARVDFALVPALAVDGARYRLGYGAGYFDKLLTGRGVKPFCVTALPAAFIVEQLPHEGYDMPVDLVLNERGPLSSRAAGP
jgi:5,10-methenyltetrahydrofolate synthetase